MRAKYGCIDYKEEMDVAEFTIEKFEDLVKVIKYIEGG